MTIAEDLQKYINSCTGLNEFLKEEMTLEESRNIITERLQNREKLFLEHMKKKIFENPESPYLKLIKTTKLEYNDIKSMVKEKGVEETLKELADKGVYLTVDEFKGRSVCERNGRKTQFKEKDFDNKTPSTVFTASSGGTRSQGTPIMINYNYITEWAIFRNILFDAFNLLQHPVIVWFPGALGAIITLDITKIGKPPIKWFTQVNWIYQMRNKRLAALKDKLMINSMIAIGKLNGIKIPRPQYIDFEKTEKIVEEITETIKEHGSCFILTYSSSALRACKIAKEKNQDIKGATFLMGGEPVTDSKKKEIESAGARIIPCYASMEAGVITMGCPNPKEPDDGHILEYYITLIQHKRKIENFDIEVDAFLATSFLPTGPKILLNVETGDMGVTKERKCGCTWEKLGLTKHLHTIRSFEKLTGEGMTILNTDLIRIIEETLPEKYGGSQTDYQLIEREDRKGFTKLDILISPDLGDIDEKKILETIHTELKIEGKDGGSANLSVGVWEKTKTLQIKREHPKKNKSRENLQLPSRISEEKIKKPPGESVTFPP